MRVISAFERYTPGDEFTLWPIGDTHLGATDAREDVLIQHLSIVEQDPNARIIFMGDAGDLIDFHDKRHMPHKMMTERYILAQYEEGGIATELVYHVCELFSKVAEQGKILGWLEGNHERTIKRKQSRHVGFEACQDMGIKDKYLGYNGYINLGWISSEKGTKTDFTTRIDVHHGWQAGRRSGSKVNQMELELGYTDADILLKGHSHDDAAQIFSSVRITRDGLVDWPRVVAHCGSYKTGIIPDGGKAGETVDTWEETMGFRPKNVSLLGPPQIIIQTPTDSSEPVTYKLVR